MKQYAEIPDAETVRNIFEVAGWRYWYDPTFGFHELTPPNDYTFAVPDIPDLPPHACAWLFFIDLKEGRYR